MTNEEAISILTKDRALCLFNPLTGDVGQLNEDCRMSAEAMKLAIEALEKQVSKKPPNHDRMVCPSCNSKARYGHPYEYYCPHCGQAILWEVSE